MRQGKPRILVVDDAGPVVILCVNILQTLGYAVKGANRGEIALEHLRAEPFDLLIVDYRMPGMDGFNSNAIVLGVSKDGIESHNQFIAKYNLPFTLLSDPETKVMQAYGAWGERKNMEGKTVEGAIRSTVVIGPDGKVLRQWAPVANAEEHPREVLQFLQK